MTLRTLSRDNGSGPIGHALDVLDELEGPVWVRVMDAPGSDWPEIRNWDDEEA